MRHGVCILRGFCPLCFRGSGIKAERVPTDCHRIDGEQRECSRALRSLPLLDLRAEGARCEHPCRLICLVCASPVAFPSEPDYEEALDALERYEEELEETRAEVMEGMRGFGRLGEQMLSDIHQRFQRRLKGLGMAWHPRWRKIVHSRCVKKAACQCLLSIGASVCPKHKRSTAPPAPRRRPPKPSMPARPQEEATPPPPVFARAGVTILRATWLKPPTSTVRCRIVEPAAPPCPPATAAQTKGRPKPKPVKANVRLQQAAAGCASLDNWKSGGQQALASSGAGHFPAFDERKHHELFDPFQHGYFSKNGVDMYRFPHGPVVQVFSSVNTLTKDGRLIPA